MAAPGSRAGPAGTPRESHGAKAPPRSRVRRGIDVVCVTLFCVVLLAPCVDEQVRDDEARGPAPELRNAARAPVLDGTLASLSSYPAGYESWYADRMGLRDVLLAGSNWTKYRVFRTSPSPMQIVGRDGWIFYTGDESVPVFRGVRPFTTGELATWAQELESRRRALAEVGCRYLFVISPNKETLYPERMPSSAVSLGPTRLDPFFAYLKEHTSVEVLDLRTALRAEKARDRAPMDAVYTPLGTHWTGRGSLAVYGALTRWVQEAFPGTRALGTDEFELLPIADASDSFALGMYLKGYLVTPDTIPIPRGGFRHRVTEERESPPRWRRMEREGDDLLPHTLLFHDSFGPFVYDQLAESFRVLDASEGEYRADRVESGRTKLVIEMFVERYLVTHAPRAVGSEPIGTLESRFDAAPRRIFELDVAGGGFESFGDMPLPRTTDGGAPAVTLRRESAGQGLLTPAFDVPQGTSTMVRVVVDAAAPASLEVMWRLTASEPAFNRTRRTILGLREGTNTLHVEIALPPGETRLLLRPTEPGVPLVLRTFEVRGQPQ